MTDSTAPVIPIGGDADDRFGRLVGTYLRAVYDGL